MGDERLAREVTQHAAKLNELIEAAAAAGLRVEVALDESLGVYSIGLGYSLPRPRVCVAVSRPLARTDLNPKERTRC